MNPSAQRCKSNTDKLLTKRTPAQKKVGKAAPKLAFQYHSEKNAADEGPLRLHSPLDAAAVQCVISGPIREKPFLFGFTAEEERSFK